MNIKNELQTLADRAVSAFKLNQDNNNNSISILMYVNSLYKHLNVINKNVDTKKKALLKADKVKEYNNLFNNEGTIEIPLHLFLSMVEVANTQEKTIKMLYSGTGEIIDYNEYKKQQTRNN